MLTRQFQAVVLSDTAVQDFLRHQVFRDPTSDQHLIKARNRRLSKSPIPQAGAAVESEIVYEVNNLTM